MNIALESLREAVPEDKVDSDEHVYVFVDERLQAQKRTLLKRMGYGRRLQINAQRGASLGASCARAESLARIVKANKPNTDMTIIVGPGLEERPSCEKSPQETEQVKHFVAGMKSLNVKVDVAVVPQSSKTSSREKVRGRVQGVKGLICKTVLIELEDLLGGGVSKRQVKEAQSDN